MAGAFMTTVLGLLTSWLTATEGGEDKEARLVPFMSDQTLSIFVPIAAYWSYSLMYEVLDYARIPLFERHRIHTPEELKTRNKATFWHVVRGVIIQQVLQVLCSLVLLRFEEPPSSVVPEVEMLAMDRRLASVLGPWPLWARYHVPVVQALYYAIIPTAQMLVAVVALDTWQYFWHRYFHLNRKLYHMIHAQHHELYVPFACGALYNHPLEGLVLDTIGAGLSFKISGMTLRMGILFFAFSTFKTVDDHCGYVFPWDPLQFFFNNNAQYHDIHHQSYGFTKNFSQPFFTFWDDLMDTKMTLEQTPAARRKAREELARLEKEGTVSGDRNGSVVVDVTTDYNTVPITPAQAEKVRLRVARS